MKMMNNIEKLISWLKADADILEGYLIKRLYLREEKCFETELIKDITLAVDELEKLPTTHNADKAVDMKEQN